jgi:protein SCO1/2
MSQATRNRIRPHRPAATLFVIFLTVLAAGLAGCNKQAAQQQGQQAQQQPQSQEKRYHLVGKIAQVQSDQNTLIVDGQDVPGFMAAMTMPYLVHAHADLAGLNAGDEITADIVVGDSGAYLENIVVTKKAGGGAGGKPSSELHQPQPGDKVPDFALVNQDGKQIHLSSFKGHPLLVTFIYTRCPFPDYCPLVSQNFAKIYADTKANPALGSKLRLLTISFDIAFDTPKILRDYAATFDKTTGGKPFARWEFAVIPPKELKTVTDYFGFYYSEQTPGQIVHSMSTSVITPQGAIYKWYDDNDWQPADLIADATRALQDGNAGTITTPAAAAISPKG